MVCTAGGHRRLPLSGVLEFIRGRKQNLVNPEAIGLPPATGRGSRSLETSRDAFRAALVAGDELTAEQVVLDLFLNHYRLSQIGDAVVAASFEEVGHLWECGEIEVYRERRSCEICLRVLHQLRTLVPQVPADAPRAIGGTPAGDTYAVASTMVELVLREQGWNATALGSSLPLPTIAAAIRENPPRLCWLSVSHLANEVEFLQELPALYQTALENQCALIVGGRMLTEPLRRKMQFSAHFDNLQQLETFLPTFSLHNPASRN